MNRLNLSNKFWRGILGVIGAILIIVVAFNLLRLTPAFHGVSNRLKNEAAKSDLQKAIVDYKLAWFLNPSDHDSAHKLATLYLQEDNVDAAVAILRALPIGESGVQIARLQQQAGELSKAEGTITAVLKRTSSAAAYAEKSRILLERGDREGAIKAAQEALKKESSSDNEIQLGLSLLVADSHSSLEALLAVNHAQALQALNKAHQSKYQLAAVLYAGGLLRSAERVLNNAQLATAPEWQLLGLTEVELAKNDASHWSKAKDALEKAAVADPANLENHRMLLQAYLKLKMTDQAAEQQVLIQRLESGNV